MVETSSLYKLFSAIRKLLLDRKPLRNGAVEALILQKRECGKCHPVGLDLSTVKSSTDRRAENIAVSFIMRGTPGDLRMFCRTLGVRF